MAEEIDIIYKESDELFLDLVRQRPCVFDKAEATHHDKTYIENAWEEIAGIMNDSVEECKNRWKKFYRAYQNEKKKIDAETRSGAAATKRTPWTYYNTIRSFFSKQIHRKTLSGVESQVQDQVQIAKIQKSTYNKKPQKPSPLITEWNTYQKSFNEFKELVTNQKTKENQIENFDAVDLLGKQIQVRLDEVDLTLNKQIKRELLQWHLDLDL